MRKGINEVIAAILMVAIVSVIAVIVVNWNIKWVTTETTSQSCLPDTNFIVESARFNLSGGDEYQVKVTNFGETALYGFGILMNSETNTMEFEDTLVSQGGVSQSSPLQRGQSAYITVNMSGNIAFAQSITDIMVTNKACPSVSTRAVIGP